MGWAPVSNKIKGTKPFLLSLYPRKRMKIRYKDNKKGFVPLILLDTGAQVSCIQYKIFLKLKAPLITKNPPTQISAANGTPLNVVGMANLELECFCYQQGCTGFQKVDFHVV